MVKRAVVVITDGFAGRRCRFARHGHRSRECRGHERLRRDDASYSQLLASAKSCRCPTPLDVTGVVEKTGGPQHLRD
jgi:hypothetical protein